MLLPYPEQAARAAVSEGVRVVRLALGFGPRPDMCMSQVLGAVRPQPQ
jgi:hypothetical protein